MLTKLRSQKGFTLIELMIVVAIIGILAAIAIPNFVAYRDKARLASATATAESIRAALAGYAATSTNNLYPGDADTALADDIVAAAAGWADLQGITAINGVTLPNAVNNIAGAIDVANFAYATVNGSTYTMSYNVVGDGTTVTITPDGITQTAP